EIADDERVRYGAGSGVDREITLERAVAIAQQHGNNVRRRVAPSPYCCCQVEAPIAVEISHRQRCKCRESCCKRQDGLLLEIAIALAQKHLNFTSLTAYGEVNPAVAVEIRRHELIRAPRWEELRRVLIRRVLKGPVAETQANRDLVIPEAGDGQIELAVT